MRYINLMAFLLTLTFMQHSFGQCRANDLLVYNMALAQMQASSFRQQKPVYFQVPEKVAHKKIPSANGGSDYLVSVNMFAITNPEGLSPEGFQKRLGQASGDDFVRITFKVDSNVQGKAPCTSIQPAYVELTANSRLKWLDIPAPKKQVTSL